MNASSSASFVASLAGKAHLRAFLGTLVALSAILASAAVGVLAAMAATILFGTPGCLFVAGSTTAVAWRLAMEEADPHL